LILLVTCVLHWEKLSPHAKTILTNLEMKLLKRNTGLQRRGVTPVVDTISKEEFEKQVKYVEASTRKKKPKKI